MKIIKDGDAYLVAADNFVDLQESSDYFFIGEEEYQEYLEKLRPYEMVTQSRYIEEGRWSDGSEILVG